MGMGIRQSTATITSTGEPATIVFLAVGRSRPGDSTSRPTGHIQEKATSAIALRLPVPKAKLRPRLSQPTEHGFPIFHRKLSKKIACNLPRLFVAGEHCGAARVARTLE